MTFYALEQTYKKGKLAQILFRRARQHGNNDMARENETDFSNKHAEKNFSPTAQLLEVETFWWGSCWLVFTKRDSLVA